MNRIFSCVNPSRVKSCGVLLELMMWRVVLLF